MREYLLVMLVAAAVTYLLTPLVRRGAVAVGAQHIPRSRDMHTKPTPLLGGLAMFGGLVAGLGVTLRLSYLQQAFPTSRYAWGLLLAAAVLIVVGFIDDRWEMGAITKLAGQVAAGGVLVWSGVEVSWIPTPNGNLISFDGLQSVTLTILLIVITINAVNFIDGLDGLAAGVVAIAALSFLVYSYTLDKTLGLPSQSLAAVASALLAGMCLGFLPHNFHPARIFMGDTGAMLLGLLLAYGPITSLQSLDPSLLTGPAYAHLHPLNRFPTILPLLLPVAILVIPYTDMMLAVVRRTRAGKSPWAADKEHLHHRLLNIGHSHRLSVLIMYLWASLFAGTVLAMSVLRTSLIWITIATVVAVLVLLPATMPRLRPGYAKEAQAREERAARAERVRRRARREASSASAAFPREQPFPVAEPFPGSGPFPEAAPFPGSGAFPASGPFPTPESFQEPFPAAVQPSNGSPSGSDNELPSIPAGWPRVMRQPSAARPHDGPRHRPRSTT